MDKAVEALVAYLEKADEALAARCVWLCQASLQAVANRRSRGPPCRPPTRASAATATARRIAGSAAGVLASKCLKGKPATLAKAGEACMLLVELEQQASVVEAVLKAFGDKVPKVVLAAVDIVLQAVRWVLAR